MCRAIFAHSRTFPISSNRMSAAQPTNVANSASLNLGQPGIGPLLWMGPNVSTT